MTDTNPYQIAKDHLRFYLKDLECYDDLEDLAFDILNDIESIGIKPPSIKHSSEFALAVIYYSAPKRYVTIPSIRKISVDSENFDYDVFSEWQERIVSIYNPRYDNVDNIGDDTLSAY